MFYYNLVFNSVCYINVIEMIKEEELQKLIDDFMDEDGNFDDAVGEILNDFFNFFKKQKKLGENDE